MTGFNGNKTVLPLIPQDNQNIYTGKRPFIHEIISQLPPGPKCIVVHHDAESVKSITKNYQLEYAFQPVLNGTGGAVLAARDFIKKSNLPVTLITMGDVPLVRNGTYNNLVEVLSSHKSGAIILFEPESKEKYGCAIIESDCVKNIIEWQYWKDMPQKEQEKLRFCNSGIYAFKTSDLLAYLDKLKRHPHTVEKNVNGKLIRFEEYFLTDLIKWMADENLCIGYTIAPETEVMGIDTPDALRKAQLFYSKLYSNKSQ